MEIMYLKVTPSYLDPAKPASNKSSSSSHLEPSQLDIFLLLDPFFSMKQKIVIKVHVKCNKCRIKAMKLAASVAGLDSITLEGDNKDQLVLIGDGVDPACLTQALRKKVGHADIVRVEEVKKKEPEKEKKPDRPPPPPPKIEWYPPCPPCPPVIYQTDDDYYSGRGSNPNICSIM